MIGQRGSHHWIMIPPAIVMRDDLTNTEKLLFGKLVGLVCEDGYAFASNDYLAGQIGLDRRTVQRCLQKLGKLGLVNIKQTDRRRRIYLDPMGGDINVTGGDTNVTGGVTSVSPLDSNISNMGYQEQKSNTVTNVTKETNSNLITKEEKSFSDEVVEVFEYYKKALVLLANMPEEKVNRMRLVLGERGRAGHINRRLENGYTVKQLKQVIVALLRDEWYLEKGLLDLDYAIGSPEKVDRFLLKYETQERKSIRTTSGASKEWRG